MKTTRYATVKCAPWTGESRAMHRVMIDGATVRVWDPVAGHYTTCHRLSPATQRRIARTY